MPKIVLLALLNLVVAPLLAQSPVISEFLASNQDGIEDEDGDSSDWINGIRDERDKG